MSGVLPPTPLTNFFGHKFRTLTRMVLGGGSCMLQEPHGNITTDYQAKSLKVFGSAPMNDHLSSRNRGLFDF